MKMNSIKIFLLILIGSCFLGSCKKFLEPGGDNQYTMERILNEPSFAEGILTAGYTALPTEYNFSEMATDDAVSNARSNSFLRMATGEWSSKFNPFDNWASSYGAIYNLNLFLSVVDQVKWNPGNPTKHALIIRKYKNEARGLRAYHYMQLLSRFGGEGTGGQILGVPLVMETIGSTGNWKLQRATFDACVQQINTDIDSAIARLPYDYVDVAGETDWNQVFGVTNKNRLSGRIARALKSKLALLAASPAFNGGSYSQTKSDVAASQAAALITERGGVASLPTDRLFWDNDNDITNTDILWRNNHFTNNARERNQYPPTLFGDGDVNPTQNLVDAFPMKNGYPIGDPSSGYDAANPYDNRDTRFTNNILRNGNTLRSTIINTGADSPTDDGLNKATNSSRTGYYLLKFLRTTVNLSPSSTNTARHFFTHIRWTEIYLNFAEASNEAWGPDDNRYGFSTRDVIARIRLRATITQPDAYLATIVTTEDMRALIRNERRLELCFEGARFWDLRRWEAGLTETAKGVSITGGTNYEYINVETRVYDQATAIYGPIPQLEILKNENLIQNNGW